MTGHDFDLRYDANEVGADFVVETWISHSPRANDATFDRQPGDWLVLGDDEEPSVRSRVVRRDGNRVRAQLDLSHTPGRRVERSSRTVTAAVATGAIGTATQS
jgi:hypothetical protein